MTALRQLASLLGARLMFTAFHSRYRSALLVLGDVLSAEECAELIALARPRLTASTIVNPSNESTSPRPDIAISSACCR